MRWLSLVLLVCGAVNVVGADADRFSKSKAYDNGKFGDFPVVEYKTSTLQGARANFYDHGGNCSEDGLYVFLTPRGSAVQQPGPMVLDAKGNLVWTNPQYREPYNLNKQTYRGEDYLTFWAGDDGVRGHGSGMYYMVSRLLFSIFETGFVVPPKLQPHNSRTIRRGI